MAGMPTHSRMLGRHRLQASALLFAFFSFGCSFVKLAGGQLELVNEQRRLDRAIASERDPERRAMLAEVHGVRRFAREVVGMNPGDSYTGYFETEREGMTYVLSASERTKLQPYWWWFPVAGKVEYRSYFDKDDALEAAAELEALGYDTWISPSRAYSTLGIFRDPVSTTMMREGITGFVEVLLHEMAHGKLYVPGHTEWNEALATFVGQRGAERYFEAPRFASTSLRAEMTRRAAQKLALDRLVAGACDVLERLYASDASDARKLQEREQVFVALQRAILRERPSDNPATWRMNNARLTHFRRYSASSDEVVALWERSGGSFRRFWQLAKEHGRTLD
jgi:predicted aminopeptidase